MKKAQAQGRDMVDLNLVNGADPAPANTETEMVNYGNIGDGEENTLEEPQAGADAHMNAEQDEDDTLDELLETMNQRFDEGNPGAAYRTCLWLHSLGMCGWQPWIQLCLGHVCVGCTRARQSRLQEASSRQLNRS